MGLVELQAEGSSVTHFFDIVACDGLEGKIHRDGTRALMGLGLSYKFSLVVPDPAAPSHILTFGLSLVVCSGVVAAETEGCPEVAGEPVRAGVDPGASAIVDPGLSAVVDPGLSAIMPGRVAGLSVVVTPWLVWSGPEGVLSSCVGARLGSGLVCSLLSPGEVGLAARDMAAALVLKKWNEKGI